MNRVMVYFKSLLRFDVFVMPDCSACSVSWSWLDECSIDMSMYITAVACRTCLHIHKEKLAVIHCLVRRQSCDYESH